MDIFKSNKGTIIDRTIDELRKNGYRITFQRKLILETMIEENSLVVKEIYYSARKKDKTIGLATVYRFIRILQNVGIIGENEKFAFPDMDDLCTECKIILSNGDIVSIENCVLKSAVKKILTNRGYSESIEIDHINANI